MAETQGFGIYSKLPDDEGQIYYPTFSSIDGRQMVQTQTNTDKLGAAVYLPVQYVPLGGEK